MQRDEAIKSAHEDGKPFTIPCQVTIGNKVTPQGIYPIFLKIIANCDSVRF